MYVFHVVSLFSLLISDSSVLKTSDTVDRNINCMLYFSCSVNPPKRFTFCTT